MFLLEIKLDFESFDGQRHNDSSVVIVDNQTFQIPTIRHKENRDLPYMYYWFPWRYGFVHRYHHQRWWRCLRSRLWSSHCQTVESQQLHWARNCCMMCRVNLLYTIFVEKKFGISSKNSKSYNLPKDDTKFISYVICNIVKSCKLMGLAKKQKLVQHKLDIANQSNKTYSKWHTCIEETHAPVQVSSPQAYSLLHTLFNPLKST